MHMKGFTPVAENDGLHIESIVNAGPCKKHAVPEGVACYQVPKSNTSGYYTGVCGQRIKKAGFNGFVSDLSLSIRNNNPRPNGQQRRTRAN